jgi:hypothetical protein
MSTNQPPQVSAVDPSGATSEGVPDARQRRTILVAVCIALMAVIASVSGLNVAQPDLAVAFGASQSTILWIINIYTLSLRGHPHDGLLGRRRCRPGQTFAVERLSRLATVCRS